MTRWRWACALGRAARVCAPGVVESWWRVEQGERVRLALTRTRPGR